MSIGADRMPTWGEFDERSPAAQDPRSPAGELAVVLQRFREQLDEAGRAAAQSRVQGFRALAEQAVLATELGNLLERRCAPLGEEPAGLAARALEGLKDRMLAHIAACGLEIVRLDGAGAADVADLVEVDCWRYDELHASPVVVEELEAAVRLDGVALRRGRVVMAGRREGFGTGSAPAAGEQAAGRAAAAAPARAAAAFERPPAPRIVCPIAGCGAENHAEAEACVGCLTPLAGFGRLTMLPRAVFNRGLRAARAGDNALARECFAAIALWHPHDDVSRNAHALACARGGDARAARRAWSEILARSANDAMAARGLAALGGEGQADER